MNSSVDRVKQVLANNNIDAEIVFLEQSAHTAEQAAQALQCDVAQIVKSLIFKTYQTQKPLLALISGDKRLDSQKLALLINEKLDKADADFVKQTTGFTIGGVAPIGSLNKLPVYMDKTLLEHREVFAAAGHPKSIFRINPDRLAEVSMAQMADLT